MKDDATKYQCGTCKGSGVTTDPRESTNHLDNTPGYDPMNPERPVPGLPYREEVARLSEVVVIRNCQLKRYEMAGREMLEALNHVHLRPFPSSEVERVKVAERRLLAAIEDDWETPDDRRAAAKSGGGM